MTSRRAVLRAAMTGAAGWSGCASPSPDLFTLAPVTPASAGASRALKVELRRIGLAAYLDRPEVVRSTADFRVTVAPNARWGEPLGDMIGRVLAENLMQRLPGSTVFQETGAISVRPDVALEVEIQRFDVDAGGSAVLVAQLGTRGGRDTEDHSTRTVRLGQRPDGTRTADQVAAMSRLLAGLADAAVGLLGK